MTNSHVEPYLYTICNDLSHQLLGHVRAIVHAITHQRPIGIPNVYIVEIPHHNRRPTMPTVRNTIPLTAVLDTDWIIEQLENQYGISAWLVPYEDGVHGYMTCSSWKILSRRSHRIVNDIIEWIRPSMLLSKFLPIESSFFDLKYPVDLGICLYHDEHILCQDHCHQDQEISLSALVTNRIPYVLQEYSHIQGISIWLYYVSDHDPPLDLKQSKYDIITRHDILGIQRKKEILDRISSQSLEWIRQDITYYQELWALFDFFTCSNLNYFIGNTVSSWSALQISRRKGYASWYPRQSLTLFNSLRFSYMPIVYTYTESSALTGKNMLKISILSLRNHMPRASVHILYHGSNDVEFQSWLQRQNIVLHPHEPLWKDSIENMRLSGDPKKSHLYAHSGNYLGTWQRIDIPLFLASEYCLLLDADTIVSSSFTLHDFGQNLTLGIALSTEWLETSTRPWNAGVALLHIPRLRETYPSFLSFISDHTDRKLPFVAPSDQGAYLEYYRKDIMFLDPSFNVKTYWKNSHLWRRRKIVHFHGAKPEDFLRSWLGQPCPGAIYHFCHTHLRPKNHICTSLQEFGKTMVLDGVQRLQEYCESTFLTHTNGLDPKLCFAFFHSLAHSTTSSYIQSCRRKIFMPLAQVIRINSQRRDEVTTRDNLVENWRSVDFPSDLPSLKFLYLHVTLSFFTIVVIFRYFWKWNYRRS